MKRGTRARLVASASWTPAGRTTLLRPVLLTLAALLTLTACATTPPSTPPAPMPTPRFTQGPYPVVCPGVSGGTGPALCSKVAQTAVLAAVANVEFPIAKITFQRGLFCLVDPFGQIPCPPEVQGAGTESLGSALVQFSGTTSEGFVNISVTSNGEFVTKARVVSPQASPTPKPQ